MTTRRPGNAAVRAAFTLMELLVVVMIVALIAVAAVPAFQSIMYSSSASLAQTRLAAAVKAARDAALQGGPGEDTAAVFFYDFRRDELGSGRLRVVTCVKVGEFMDPSPSGGSLGGVNNPVLREVFVPLNTSEPIELPRGWVVRAYVPPGLIDTWWYEGSDRYTAADPTGNWVFPETAFYKRQGDDALASGGHRQTFMIRFQGGTGALAPTSGGTAVVLSPAYIRRDPNLPAWKRPDLATDYRRYARRILARGDLRGNDNVNNPGWRLLLGDQSVDTVLARHVWMFALYDEARLASALNVQTDRRTGCLYTWYNDGRVPRYVSPLDSNLQLRTRLKQWIVGDTNFDGEVRRRQPSGAGNPPRRGDVPEARIFTIDRYTGEVKLVEFEQ